MKTRRNLIAATAVMALLAGCTTNPLSLIHIYHGLQLVQRLPAQRSYSVRARLTIYDGYLLSLRLQPGAVERLRAGVAEARACRDVGALIGYCVLASLEGREGRCAEAFALLGEAERLMLSLIHI